MGRPRESEPNSVSNAVQELRAALGQTQQEFAGVLGVSITSVARWETTRPPTGKALISLWRLARKHSFWEPERILNLALREMYSTWYPKPEPPGEPVYVQHELLAQQVSNVARKFVEPENDEERAVVQAVLLIWRGNPGLSPKLKSELNKLIGPCLQDIHLFQQDMRGAAQKIEEIQAKLKGSTGPDETPVSDLHGSEPDSPKSEDL